MRYTQKTDQEELDMMQSPDRWPIPDLLPVKQRPKGGGWPETGLLYRQPGQAKPKPIVYRINVFNWAGVEGVPTTEYQTFEELYADGWVVD